MKKTITTLILASLVLFTFWGIKAVESDEILSIENTAGKLQEKLGDKEFSVTHLTISGELNSTDLKVLHQMIQLQRLDIQSVSLVMGGVGYEYNGKTVGISYANFLPMGMFDGFAQLESISLPNNMMGAEAYALARCSALKTVILPASCVSIGKGIFKDCQALETVNLQKISELPEDCFKGCLSLSKVDKGVIKNIGKQAFYGCKSLKTMSFSKGILTIGERAFSECESLTGVSFSTTTTTIGDYAFENCTKLEQARIPYSVTTFGQGAFKNCTSLSSVNLTGKVTVLPQSLYEGCTSLGDIWLGSKVETIECGVFNGCTSLALIRSDKTTAPNVQDNSFGTLEVEKIRLVVNKNSQAAYGNHSVWKKFLIEEVENPNGDAIVSMQIKSSSDPYILKFRCEQPLGALTGKGLTSLFNAGSFTTAKTQKSIDNVGTSLTLHTLPSALSILYLDAETNHLQSIRFKKANGLKDLVIKNSELSIADLKEVPNLIKADLTANDLHNINTTGNEKLESLKISNNPNLTEIDLSKNEELTSIEASSTGISTWNLSNNSKIKYLMVEECMINDLQIVNLTDLRRISVARNNIKSLMLPPSEYLAEVNISDCKLDTEALNNLYKALPNRGEFAAPGRLYIANNPGVEKSATVIAIQKNWEVDEQGTGADPEAIDPEKDKPAIVLSSSAASFALNITSQKNEDIYVQWDPTVKTFEKISLSKDVAKKISHKFEDAQPHQISIFGKEISEISTSMFSSIKLTYLDVSLCPTLVKLNIPYGNTLGEVNLKNNVALQEINLDGCGVKTLTMPDKMEALTRLLLSNNDIRQIKLNGATQLKKLSMPSNKLRSIDLSSCTQLEDLNLNLNGLEEIIGIHELKALTRLDLGKNNLPFSMIPAKGNIQEYVYNQYWYDIPQAKISELTIDLSQENMAQGESDKMEQTTFSWMIMKSAEQRIPITEKDFVNEGGKFTFKNSLFPAGVDSLDIYVLMTNPGFPAINTKTGGVQSSAIRIGRKINLQPSDVPLPTDNLFEGLYECAFIGAKNLKTIKLPKNTKEIRERAFEACHALEGVQLAAPIATEKWGDKVFEDKDGLTIYVPNEETKKVVESRYQFTATKVVVGGMSYEKALASQQKVYVRVVGSSLFIQSLSDQEVEIRLFDASGAYLLSRTMTPDEEIEYALPSEGIFLLSVDQENTIKILIPNQQ